MAQRSRLSSFVSNVQDMFKPKSLISVGVKDEFYDVSQDDLERVPFEDLEKLYLKDPMCFSGINLFSQGCWGRGGYVDSKNKKAKELCEKIISSTTFRPTFVGAITNTLIYGVGFQEIVWSDDKKDIEGFRLVDPKSLKMKWDEHGTITQYAQIISGSKKATFEPEQMVFHKYFQIADGMKGIGFIEPIKDDLEIKQDMEQSIKELIHKFGYPPIHVVKKGEKDEKVLTATQKKMRKIRRQSLFVTNENTTISAVEIAKSIPNLAFYVKMIIDNISAGLRVPTPFLLGRGDTVNRATAFALMDYSNFEITLIQGKLTKIIEEQIFAPVCLKNNLPVPDFHWHPLKTEDEVAKAKLIKEKVSTISEAVKSELLSPEEGKAILFKMMDKQSETTPVAPKLEVGKY